MIITTDNIHKQYGSHGALNGLSLSVPEGSAFALIGANGAGKTTTIKILMNMLTASRGSASVLGVDSRKLSPRELAQIGYVSENQDMPRHMTVGRYLDYLRPFYPTWDRQLEAAVMQQLRLPLDRKIGALSHGMRMKMSLACALVFRPKLLILDEPFSGLDPLARDEFMEGFIASADQMTVFVSSHELTEIEGLVTHVAFVDQGRLLFQESMDDLTGRLREVRITLSVEATTAIATPREWLRVRAHGNVLGFVDTRFDETTFNAHLARLFRNVQHVDIQALPLRAMFTTLARAAQNQGVQP